MRIQETKTVLIIGGGIAGLAAAVELARRGCKTTLLEEKHFLGGRAYSFRDPQTGEVLDNGQHVLLTTYTHTWKFLKFLGTLKMLALQPLLDIAYREPGGRDLVFNSGRWPGPVGLFDWLRLTRGLARDKNRDDLDQITVEKWLDSCAQPEKLRHILYRPLALAALNQQTDRASAALGVEVLRPALSLSNPPQLAIPAAGLSELFVDPAVRFLQEHGGAVYPGQRAEALLVERDGVTGVRSADGKIWKADVTISAVPPRALSRLIPEDVWAKDKVLANVGTLTHSAVICLYLWLDKPLAPRSLIGLLDVRIQWLFNRQALFARTGREAASIALVSSGANDLTDVPKEKLVQMVMEDMAKLYPGFSSRNVLRYVVIKEKTATLSHEPGQLNRRPGCATPWKNFFLAGDWINTGLPSTLESAVQSAHTCVDLIGADAGPWRSS